MLYRSSLHLHIYSSCRSYNSKIVTTHSRYITSISTRIKGHKKTANRDTAAMSHPLSYHIAIQHCVLLLGQGMYYFRFMYNLYLGSSFSQLTWHPMGVRMYKLFNWHLFQHGAFLEKHDVRRIIPLWTVVCVIWDAIGWQRVFITYSQGHMTTYVVKCCCD